MSSKRVFVVGGGAQRLAARQQEIAGEAVLHAHDVAHLAELPTRSSRITSIVVTPRFELRI